MNNDTNQNVTPDIKTEEISKKEKVKKPKKEKKVKKEKVPKEPMDKQDQLCYLGAMIFFVLALLPLLLRNFDPSYDEYRDANSNATEETPAVIKTLYCNKTVSQIGYEYLEEIESVFEDSNPKQTTITYTITISDEELTLDQIEIPEYTTIVGLNQSGITGNIEENVYTLTINYKVNEALKENVSLDSHNKILVSQREIYTNDGFQCVLEETNNGIN